MDIPHRGGEPGRPAGPGTKLLRSFSCKEFSVQKAVAATLVLAVTMGLGACKKQEAPQKAASEPAAPPAAAAPAP
ncbi:flagellar motor protein MotB, partial [Paracidovorax avenae]